MEFRWKEISRAAYAALNINVETGWKTFGSVTDIYGEFGTPLIMTEWGIKDADFPMVKMEVNPKDLSTAKFFIAYWYEVHP